jgi:hypothetical protein
MPAGLIALFWPLTPASMFLILYALTAVYFSGVMVTTPSPLSPASLHQKGFLCLTDSIEWTKMYILFSSPLSARPARLSLGCPPMGDCRSMHGL